MKYLVVLVFGAGFFGLAFMLLSFALRFFLLTWGVRLVGGVVQSVLRFATELIHLLVFVFGTALLGAFIITLGLQLALTYVAEGESADPTMPLLWGVLAFFVIVAVRSVQWNVRRNRQKVVTSAGPEARDTDEVPKLADYPAGYENVAEAWSRAIALAPRHRNELLGARATCAGLVTAVEQQDHIPDSAMIETAALIRNHLAALVDSTERHLRSAKPSERKAKIEEMVKFLRGFAQRAQRDIKTVGLSADDEDSALRAHLTAQLLG